MTLVIGKRYEDMDSLDYSSANWRNCCPDFQTESAGLNLPPANAAHTAIFIKEKNLRNTSGQFLHRTSTMQNTF